MARFGKLAGDLAAPPAPAETKSPGRVGRVGVMGYFSPELSRALKGIALDEGTSLQAVIGEAFDLLLRARGKHPFGER